MTTPTGTAVESFSPEPRLDVDTLAPAYLKALAHLDHTTTKALDEVGVDARLRELVKARASQLNGCAYCVDMHSTDARAVGETEQRLYALPVWRDTPFFTDAERAALAFTEAVTTMTVDHVPAAVVDELARHFSPEAMAALLCQVVTINAWNAIGVSTHAWLPGSYQP
jgi:AhpD family alkylhydroperoxidase